MYNQSQNENENENQGAMSNGAFAIIATAIVVPIMISKNAENIKRWYFNNYEEIYLTIWAIALVIFAFIFHHIRKKTKNIADRGELLSPLWDKKLDNIVVGLTADHVELHLSDESRCTHVQIIGTTGRGKTQSVIIPWAVRDLERYKSVILIDGKGSPDVPATIIEKLEQKGLRRKVYIFDLDDVKKSVKINPLSSGTPQQITD